MHRVITNAPDGMVVDHINGNPLDNRKCNLRVVTQAQNQQNRTVSQPRRVGPDLPRGVRFDYVRGKYVAQCQYLGRNRFGGRYDSVDEAEKAAISLRSKLGFLDNAILAWKEPQP